MDISSRVSRRLSSAPAVLLAAGLVAAVLAAPAPSADAASAGTVIRINSGGPAGTFEGQEWQADRWFVGGRTSVSRDVVSGTTSSTLYQDRRVAPSAYDIPVTAGTYDVTVLSAETYWKADGARRFSVVAEGLPLVQGVDLHAVAGHDRAWSATRRVQVLDGLLDIDFSATVDNAVVAGVVVAPVEAPPSATPTPTPTPTAPSAEPTAEPTAAPTALTSPTAVPSALTSPTAAPTALTSPTTAPTALTSPTAASTTPAAPSAQAPWRAPVLVDPIVWVPSPEQRVLKAPADRDVLVRWPATELDGAGGYQITGGRNVVSIGGTVRYSSRHVVGVGGEADRNRCLYVRGHERAQAPRTVHVEGLRCAGEHIWEGINIDSKAERGTLTVQMRDITIDEVQVAFGADGKHIGGDALQTWNGPHKLLVDRFDARQLHYQGLILQPYSYGSGALGRWQLHDVYLEGDTTGCAYLLWLSGSRSGTTSVVDIAVSDVLVKTAPGKTATRTLWDRAADWYDVQTILTPALPTPAPTA